jgi:acyl carrier protein
MLNNNYNRERLINLIREEIGEFKKQFDSNSQIEDDLGITGDDAIELILKISKEFKIDITEFEFEKYFHPEPIFFINNFKTLPLTILDIENAIVSGKLI